VLECPVGTLIIISRYV